MDVSLSWFQPVPFKINIIIIDLCEWCACAKWRLMYDTNFLLLALMDELSLPIMKRWSNFQLHISHLHRQSMMKINLILFSYCHPNINTERKKRFNQNSVRVKWVPFYIKSWIYDSVALNVKCTPFFFFFQSICYITSPGINCTISGIHAES